MKVILDLCGGTGAWSKPYKDNGYNVEVITLPKYDVRKVEFGTHTMEFKRMDVHYNDSLCVPYKDVYGILAAPPCTMFSRARTRAKNPRDFRQGIEVVEACLIEIICGAYGSYDKMPTGAIVATTNLMGCFKIIGNEKYREKAILEGGLKVAGSEYFFGDYTPGRYAWKMGATKMLDKPIPVRGQQGIWNFEYNPGS